MFFAITGITNSALDIIVGILFIFLTIVILACAIIYIIKNIGKEKGANLKKALLIILILGFLIRVLLSLAVIGHRRELFEVIYATLKDPDYYVDPLEPPSNRLYPLTYYLISLFASPFISSDVSYDNVITNLFIKMPFIIADVVTGYLMFRSGKKFANEYVGIALCAVITFSPIFLFASTLWGSFICLLLPVFLGVFLSIVEKKYALAIVLTDVALIIAKEGMIIFPVVFAYFLVVWVKNLIDVITKKSTKTKFLFIIPIVAVLSKILIYVVSIPYTGPILGNSYTDFVNLFFVYPIKENWYFGINTLNIYSIFGFNGQDSKSVLNQFLIAMIFAIFIVVITAIIYHMKRNRAVVLLLGSFTIYTIYSYFVGFSSLSLLPALPLLLLAFVFTKDKRYIIAFSICSVLLISLVSTIYVYAGYYNALPIDSFLYSDLYTGGTWLNNGAFKVILIVLSVLNLLNHVYLTLTTFDVAINNRVLNFEYDNKVTIKNTIKQIFTNSKK